jgi:hypothetical protein
MKRKHVFWQALLVALFIFWAGFVLGYIFENSRVETVRDDFFDSETDIVDFELALDIVYTSNQSCEFLRDKSVYFADKIFEEAAKLTKYDSSNKITSSLVEYHRRYDFLRTLLWMDLIKSSRGCEEEINTVVYLYDYQSKDITLNAKQAAMSNFLIELKEEYMEDIILIPIAADTDVESLEVLREQYNLTNIPVIFVNEKHKFEDISYLDEIETYLFE